MWTKFINFFKNIKEKYLNKEYFLNSFKCLKENFNDENFTAFLKEITLIKFLEDSVIFLRSKEHGGAAKLLKVIGMISVGYLVCSCTSFYTLFALVLFINFITELNKTF